MIPMNNLQWFPDSCGKGAACSAALKGGEVATYLSLFQEHAVGLQC